MNLIVSGLATRTNGTSLETLSEDRRQLAFADFLVDLDIDATATHCSVISTDGSYTASIPIADLRSGGMLRFVPPDDGGPIRLQVLDGSTLCWNVKDVGELRFTAGSEPDSIPPDPTH
jgi:DMSO/TMAO reductase YedYZ molybdopterin-dependent catalytic subunit